MGETQNGGYASRTTTTTMAFLGCGNMGIAILNGLLAGISGSENGELNGASSSSNSSGSKQQPSTNSHILPTHFILCVKSEASADRLTLQYASEKNRVSVLRAQNVDAVRRADVLLLGCKPHMVEALLNESGLRDQLQGKLLISIAAGWSRKQLETLLYGSATSSENGQGRCWVVRAMPNVAAAVSQSATAVEASEPYLPTRYADLVDAVFGTVGTVSRVTAAQMDVCTALGGSTPAFFAIICDALIDGAVAMGLPRQQAKEMTFQAMQGSAQLLKNGDTTLSLKEKVTSPGGCTIGGIMVLEEGGLRGTVGKALRESTSVAALLAQGYSNVNGTKGLMKPQ